MSAPEAPGAGLRRAAQSHKLGERREETSRWLTCCLHGWLSGGLQASAVPVSRLVLCDLT